MSHKCFECGLPCDCRSGEDDDNYCLHCFEVEASDRWEDECQCAQCQMDEDDMKDIL